MTAGDVAAVVVSVAAVIAVMLLAGLVVAATRTLTAVRTSVEELRRETLPVVVDLQRAAKQANGELDRVDTLLTSAESVSATVDSFSSLAYLAFSNPLIKVMAFASGTGKAAKALRRRR